LRPSAVVSDWDGYRDGVRQGLDGFLIPTCAPPPDIGMDIAEAYSNDRHYGAILRARRNRPQSTSTRRRKPSSRWRTIPPAAPRWDGKRKQGREHV
jgi:hypothetical protein